MCDVCRAPGEGPQTPPQDPGLPWSLASAPASWMRGSPVSSLSPGLCEVVSSCGTNLNGTLGFYLLTYVDTPLSHGDEAVCSDFLG